MIPAIKHENMTLTEVLAEVNMYSESVRGSPGKHRILANDAPLDIPEFVGNSKETWVWLRETGRIL